MKRLLLLFALKCYALSLPSINNPAIWSEEESWRIEKASLVAFRYAEPFEGFHNGKMDVMWSDGRFLTAAGFGSAVLDSIYRELEFSGSIAYKAFNFLSMRVSETARVSWVPENGSWQEHKISAGADLLYKDWAQVSVLQKTYLTSETPAHFSLLLSCEISFSSLYAFGVQKPINEERGINFRIYQQIALGYFGIYNSFAYPGPTLGFGFALSAKHFSTAVGHLRGSYPAGHTGYVGVWRLETLR
ncbi:MAG: hypothetical protein LBU89_08045 [Fibromonadaceae bacterium]|jgi:hypothetical protein|nr:hypothetical protein [Fibromonadaceae bacterium]